ncbi:flocculation protein FLO11 isoform X1 [Oncorhynchus tshawytscha]|uniref:flocculation protein FLO11 isoform X1 n=1 Tax=Oncorhynchus tshawytscha TaxID=74940 RepID=UPI001C3DC331|nr:flocculation protein FLO11 isoform X1 [Oncorhynchus tshawytscha]
MAENVRSPFEYREPPTLDSDGDGSKPPLPPRGRGCVRKRKGTPVKVCDRAYVTEDEEEEEEESLSEHSYSPGDGQYPDGAEDRLPPTGSPYYLADPSQLCVSELGEEGASGVRGPVLFHPPPNCRIREVHCGSQVRLVVIAIRDIAKGEEITVDYSLMDWGENAMDEEPGPHPLSLSDYLTPSWSLSPSSSPLTHTEPSDSDREEEEEDDDDDEEEEMEELRGRMLRRRKKRKIATPPVTAKKKSVATPRAGPGRPCSSSFSRLAASSTPTVAQTPSQPATPLAPPTTNINNNININIGSSSGATVSRRQHCPYCGRHYRSLARHLEKHHANQPEVRAAMELSALHTHPSSSTSSSHGHIFASPQPSSSSTPAPPPLFSRERERDAVAARSSSGAVSFSLSLSPPSASQSAAAKKASNVSVQTPKPGSAPAVAPVKSPPTSTPPRRGRKPKREKEEQQKAEESIRSKEEEIPPPPTPKPEEEELDEELSGAGTVESPGDWSTQLASSHRHHMPPLLSSLSCLVLYLSRQQHSSFLSLTRSPSSAEAWRLLCHSSLALLILYNRHRECEVAKLTTQDYHNRTTPKAPP